MANVLSSRRSRGGSHPIALTFAIMFAFPAYGQQQTMTVAAARANLHIITFGHIYGVGPAAPYAWADTKYANVDNLAAARPTEQQVCGIGKHPVEWTRNIAGAGIGEGIVNGIKDQHGYVVFLCVPTLLVELPQPQ